MKRKITCVLAVLLVQAHSFAQSFNVDLNINSDPAIGGGVPSDSFGAAANQPGRWNDMYILAPLPWLYDLQGVQRNVSISIDQSGGASGGGYRNLNNTGDFAKLLNDGRVGGISSKSLTTGATVL